MGNLCTKVGQVVAKHEMLKLQYISILKSTSFFHQLCVVLHVRTVLALQMTLATVLLDTKGKDALIQVCCTTARILVHMVPGW